MLEKRMARATGERYLTRKTLVRKAISLTAESCHFRGESSSLQHSECTDIIFNTLLKQKYIGLGDSW